MSTSECSLTLPAVAARLGLPWYTAHRLALRAELGPIQQVAGRWLLSESGVAAFEARRKLAAKKTPATVRATKSAVGSADASQTGKVPARLPRVGALSEEV